MGMREDQIRILVADDDPHTRKLIEIMCRDTGYELIFATNGQEALKMLEERGYQIQLVLSDVMMPHMGGEDLLAALKKVASHVPVVLMTSHGSIDSAVKFLKAGAVDYITKPLHKEVLLHRLKAVLGTYRLTEEVGQLRRELERTKDLTRIIGQSPELLSLLKKLPFIAKTDASVIIYGENGTGKELIARAIHSLSHRSKEKLVVLNCTALPENLLETELFGYKKGAFTDAHRDYDGIVKEADKGTLFLDEIGDIPTNIQVKLLRFLQQKEYKPVGSTKVERADVRFISATNKELLLETRKGTFREDLYYRLNVIPLTLPPLRERKSDIPLLADYFLKRASLELGKPNLRLMPSAIEKLLDYHWPGNIRELENKILQIVVMSDREVISPDQISFDEEETKKQISPVFMQGALGTFKEDKARVIAQFEENYISKMLLLHRGNVTQAARAAGMDRKNFWQKMKRYNIDAKAFSVSNSA